MNLTNPPSVTRRKFLRGSGVALALPMLETFGINATPPRRMVAINFELSFHPPNLVPDSPGPDYSLPLYLQPLQDLRRDFTFVSGTSHPEVDGGHSASKSWLTGAPHPGASNFKNSISVDQVAARQIGLETRFAYLSTGSGLLSTTANGVGIRPLAYPSRTFEMLFLEGKPDEKARQIRRLREGRSVLDTVRDAARDMQRRVSKQDREKVDEYFTAIREAERMLQKSEQWQHKPKPKVEVKPLREVRDKNAIIERTELHYELIYLSLLTDSTRLVTFGVGDSNATASLPGISMNYHDLSHHGRDPEKLKQLAIIEAAHLRIFGDFLRRLKNADEGNSNLLDRTMVLLGSHMHSGNHNNRNLPILLAGGGFQHGRHLAFDQNNNTPLANLFVSMLQQLGLEVDRFASSTGTLTGLTSA